MKKIEQTIILNDTDIKNAIRKYVSEKYDINPYEIGCMVDISYNLTPATKTFTAKVGKDIYDIKS